ncbi:MAG: hypothetical protein KDJ31_17740 [Candidatus Competibacteraceae bacterium]|nr:hypothetical protein [Candidatus Competibacteraceae bacterium]
MTDHFLPDYGLYLLHKGLRPEARWVFFDLPVDHLTRPALRTVSLTLSTEEQGQEYAISFDFTGPRIDDLLATFPEPARERLWHWLENPTTMGQHLSLSPAATLHTVEATLGAVQQGRYERFAPLIVQRVTHRP